MNLLLLAPLGLAALAALLVPLVVHLHRRSEEVPVDFAALRWLDPRPRPRRKLKFDEWLLLALRLLLVALLALLLARPAVLGWEDDGPRFLAAPGVNPAAARAAAGPEADLRWIAPGFPEVTQGPPPTSRQVSSLIRDFDATLPREAALTILVPPVLDGVDAERPRLTRRAAWRILSGTPEARRPAEPASPALEVRHAAGQEDAVQYFRAAAQAWTEQPRFAASTDIAAMPPRDRVLVWLFPGPLPQAVGDWVNAGGTALLASDVEAAMPATSQPLWSGETGRTLVEGGASGKGRLMRLAVPLVPSAMPELLAPDFPAALRRLLAPPAPPPARVAAAAFAPAAGAAPYEQPPRALSPWLGLLIALVFLAERLLASRRGRFAA